MAYTSPVTFIMLPSVGTSTTEPTQEEIIGRMNEVCESSKLTTNEKLQEFSKLCDQCRIIKTNNPKETPPFDKQALGKFLVSTYKCGDFEFARKLVSEYVMNCAECFVGAPRELFELMIKSNQVTGKPFIEYIFICSYIFDPDTLRLFMNHKFIGDPEALKLCGIDENPPGGILFDIFMRYVEKGKYEHVKVFVQECHKLNYSRGNIAINVASRLGYFNIVRLLFNTGKFSPTVGCLWGGTLSQQHNGPLREAIQHGYSNIVDLLLRDERTNNIDLDDIVNGTLKSNNCTTMRILLSLYGDKIPASTIVKASSRGLADIVDTLLNRKFMNKELDIQQNYDEAIVLASEAGFGVIVKMLLKDKRGDPTYNGCQSLKLATTHGHVNVVKLLLADKKIMQKCTPQMIESLKLIATENNSMEISLLLLQVF